MCATCIDKSTVLKWQKVAHPAIPIEVQDEWQHIITLMAKLLRVPSGLIMRLEEEFLLVYICSETANNPYNVGDKEVWSGSGLYCETVIRSGERLFIANALEDDRWKNNPDVKLNMINYLGFPIYWPNGDLFGTICVLDNKTHHYTDIEEELMVRFKKIIETNLSLIERTNQLEDLAKELECLANRDSLTNAYTRRAFYDFSKKELGRAKRQKHTTSVLMIDLDYFKRLNDQFGHHIGDDALREFGFVVENMKRAEDIFGRVGGEEFIIFLPETKHEGAIQFAERLRSKIAMLNIPTDNGTVSFTVSIGVSECEYSASGLQQIIDEADSALYASKESGRDQVSLYRNR